MQSLTKLVINSAVSKLFNGALRLNKSPQVLASYSSISGNRKERARFYRQVLVTESFVDKSKSNDLNSPNRLYEIVLDKRKLKTPAGKLFQVDNELLANMIRQEWTSQASTIKMHTMHLTSLVNTCIDNPNKVTKEGIIKQLNDYLQTDTLLYFDSNSIEKLDHLQETKWRPIVNWFNEKFPDLGLQIQKEIDVNPESSPLIHNDLNEANSFTSYLERNFNTNTLVAFTFIAECLKSVILTVALLERHVFTVEETCSLANLEQQHQYDQWGKVEWYHDVNEAESKGRVSSGLLFIYLSNSSKYLIEQNTRQKAIANN
jgi:ATP synthase F1 complex assembly factor 2